MGFKRTDGILFLLGGVITTGLKSQIQIWHINPFKVVSLGGTAPDDNDNNDINSNDS